MLRRWHRLLAPFFAAFLLFIGLTGVAIQITDMVGHAQASARASAAKPVRRSAVRQWNHWFKELHSGEMVGISGQAVGLLSGVALCYLSASGLWMYVDMARRRRRGARRRKA